MSDAPTVITNGSLPGANGTSLSWPSSRSCRRRSRRRHRSATASRPPGRADRRRGSRGFVACSEKLATRMLYCALFWRIQSQAATMSATVASPWSFITSTRRGSRSARRRRIRPRRLRRCRRRRSRARSRHPASSGARLVRSTWSSTREPKSAREASMPGVDDRDRRCRQRRRREFQSTALRPTHGHFCVVRVRQAPRAQLAPCRSARSPTMYEVFARYVIWAPRQHRVETVDRAERPPDLRSADRVRSAVEPSSPFCRPLARPSAGSSPRLGALDDDVELLPRAHPDGARERVRDVGAVVWPIPGTW